MANRRTTFELTDVTEPLLATLEKEGFDLRSITNGALLAFVNLSGDEQKRLIAQANGIESNDPAELAATVARMCIRTYQGLSTKDFSVSLQFLSDIESKAIREMLEVLNPQYRRKKKKKA